MSYDIDALADQAYQDAVSGEYIGYGYAGGVVELPVDGYSGEELVDVEDLGQVGATIQRMPMSACAALRRFNPNLRATAPRGPVNQSGQPRFRFAPGDVPFQPRLSPSTQAVQPPVTMEPRVSGPTILPLDSGSNLLPAGGDATLIVNPLFIARGTKMVISPSIATAFETGNPSVGGKQTWAGNGSVPGDCFPPDGLTNILTPSMNPSQGLQLPISNISGAPARFRGFYACESART